MLTRRLFLSSLASALALLAWRPAWAQATHSTKVTFVLFNDFYIMGEQAFPDGGRRGGFARLAAVIKAERAKAAAEGRHVIVAHGGDTLSPSTMSALDHGAHIVALTNMIAPDILVPGNHEFDFGKAVFLERMGEARFPLYAANLRDASGATLPAFKDRAILEFEGVRLGLTGLTYDQSPQVSSPDDLKFASTIDTTKQQAAALRAAGADFVCALMHANRGDSLKLQYERAAELLLTGHTHDLFVNFDDKCALVESGYDAHYVTCVDLAISVREDNGKRTTTWWPQFRVIDTATVAPDPEVAAAVARFEKVLLDKMTEPICTTAVALDSSTSTLRTREAAIGNLFADAMRAGTRADVAILNGGGIRIVVLETSGRDLKSAIENGLSKLPQSSGRFPQVSGITVEFSLDREPGNRVTAMRVGGAPLDESRSYRVATLDFLARGGDEYTMFTNARRITPDNDAPLMVNEVVAYLRGLQTVRTGVEGRMVGR